jgi:hypothetical protein
MKMINRISILVTVFLVILLGDIKAQAPAVLDKQAVLDSLTTIDPNIRKYFPRWKICEPDLQVQIYQAFLYYNYDKKLLDQQNIEVMASPREFDDEVYQILLISCGEVSMNAVQIESNIGSILLGFLSGDMYYSGSKRGEQQTPPKRDYCFQDIPTEIPLSQSQAETIVNFLQPTNVTQAFTLSLFEQSLKIGETGFWLRSIYGNDEIGYPFWYTGAAKIVLQRPLYVNSDSRTNRAIPYLINAYLGGSYRVQSGLNPSSLLSWIPKRVLNNANDGKMVVGLDVHMPFKPEFGVALRAELPLKSLEPYDIEKNTYGYLVPEDRIIDNGRIDTVAPVLRNSGVFSLFYNWWLNPKNPENYIRFDLGLNYSEVTELGLNKRPGDGGAIIYSLDPNVDGLITYKNKEFGDWVYAKVEYRNQAAYPFGVSLQYSNQVIMGDAWIPLFGNWLYLQAKYSTPLRGLKPYEIKNFFMISPLLRLTI